MLAPKDYYKVQDILLTNQGAHKELNNHNIYNIHNWINLNTHDMKTTDRINNHMKTNDRINIHMKTNDRINIHKKQTQHDILKETINRKTGNMFYVCSKGVGGGATPLIISPSFSLFNESSNFTLFGFPVF